MRAYDFNTHNKTVKRDKSRYFSYAFIFLLVAALAAFIYYVALNSPRIMYYFRENKYSGIEKAHEAALAAIQNEKDADAQTLLQNSEIVDFIDLAHTLQKDHSEDAILVYHEATLLAEVLRKQVYANNQAIIFLFFRDFIQKPIFPPDFDYALWQRVVLLGRKARALGLPDVLA
ncbi:MAG TPA: hypothetical protein PLY93_08780, partial [Turneriella sp.]|nr:hypothetical protein [Turneriella sp.]